MKHHRNLIFLWSVLSLTAPLPLASSAPLAKLTVRSYGDLVGAVNQVMNAVKPDSQADVGQSLAGLLGLGNSGSFDAQRPWQVAVWYDGRETPPWIALKVPANDVKAFQESLEEKGALRQHGGEWSQLADGFALITMGESDALPESDKESFEEWKDEAIPSLASAIRLDLNPSQPLREKMVKAISEMKTSISQMVATNEAFAATGGNPKAMGEFFNAYFGMIETAVDGLDRLSLELDVTAEALAASYVITPRPDTELAQWLEKDPGHIAASDLSLIDPKATVAVAGYFGSKPAQTENFQKLMRLSLLMQNVEPNDPAVEEFMDLLESMFPMTIAASANFMDGLTFSGVYRFPEAKTEDLYARMKTFYRQSFQSMVGDDKMYSSATLTERHRLIDDVVIDRFTFTINTNSPWMTMPGQKEQFASIWPDGKIEVDYAVQGDRLLIASPGRMEDLLMERPAAAIESWLANLDETTALAGYFNFLSFIKMSVASNPMVPPPVKESMATLETAGTSLEFQVNVDQRLRARVKVPMQFFRALGKLNRNAEPAP